MPYYPSPGQQGIVSRYLPRVLMTASPYTAAGYGLYKGISSIYNTIANSNDPSRNTSEPWLSNATSPGTSPLLQPQVQAPASPTGDGVYYPPTTTTYTNGAPLPPQMNSAGTDAQRAGNQSMNFIHDFQNLQSKLGTNFYRPDYIRGPSGHVGYNSTQANSVQPAYIPPKTTAYDNGPVAGQGNAISNWIKQHYPGLGG